MKSKDRTDPSRLHVDDVDVVKHYAYGEDESQLRVTVTFLYDTWWGSTRDCDVLAEYAGALECVSGVLRRGGVGDE